jgi:multiple sugar transport system substrate-binding protein
MKALSRSILLLLITVLVLAGCASPAPEESGGNAAKPSGGETNVAKPGEKVIVNYWTHERGRADFLESVVARFNETNEDNIEVVITFLSDNFAQAIDIAYSSNQSPDIWNISTTQVGPLSGLIAKDYLEPLDSYITPELDERFKSMKSEGVNSYNGEIYSFPNFGTTYRLIYNVDLLEGAGYSQAPKTLDEMVDAAKKITQNGKENGIYGFSLPYKSAQSAFRRSAHVIATQSGFESSGFDFKTAKYDFTGYKDIIQAFRQMWVDGSTLPGSDTMDIDPLRAQFAEGKIGMYFSSAVEPGVLNKQFTTEINWAAAPVPTQTGEPAGAAYMDGGTWYGMSKASQNKDKAWKFLEYMYGEQVLTESQEIAGWITIVPDIVVKAQIPDIPGTEYFLPGKYDAIWPLPPENIKPEGKTADQELVDFIIVGGDLDAVINGLNQRYNAALERSGQQVAPDASFDPKKFQGQ